jgi:hypothetical protein
MHRLNTAEYNATVRDVLGTKLEPATASWRGGELSGFDNMAAALSVDAAQYERYFAAAKALAADVVGSEDPQLRSAGCDLSAIGCPLASLGALGLRLFRRPLLNEELALYSEVYDEALALGDAPQTAFELALRAMLSSAQFLYRIELDALPGSSSPPELASFHLASRLSYFLWSSAPDDALLQAAADGSLEATLPGTVDRMLRDPKASRFAHHFAGQWLGARFVISHAAAPELYHWTPLVARAAGDEMVLYFTEFLNDDRSWFDFLKADVNYVTEPLARYYGIPTPTSAMARVEHRTDLRAGFLGLAGFLATSSFDRRTSPSLRGRWISSNLLCSVPAPPPPNVPELAASADGGEPANVRQSLELHRQSPACAGCHALLDPYGLALEEYDAVGQYRTAYADGSPVDAAATLPPSDLHPAGQSFVGLGGLSNVVTADPRFGSCLAQKLLTYGLGRTLTPDDLALLTPVVERWRAPGQTPSIRRLIQELVQSDAFGVRRGVSAP